MAGISYEWREKFWEKVLSNPTGQEFVYVAEDNEREVIGFASGGPERSGDVTYKGELYAIYLLEQFQRQGIGRQLALAVVERLVQMGFYSMLVWILEKNPSRVFYVTLGGQQVYEKEINFAETKLIEIAYGWQDICVLSAKYGSPKNVK